MLTRQLLVALYLKLEIPLASASTPFLVRLSLFVQHTRFYDNAFMLQNTNNKPNT